MTRITRKLHTDLYLEAARQLDLQSNIISKEFAYAEITNNQKTLRIKNTSLSSNDMVASTIAGCKVITSQLLSKAGISVPKQYYFGTKKEPVTQDTIEEIITKARDLYPLVLKRAYGAGGSGVYVNIQNEAQLRERYDRLLKKYTPTIVIIEEFIKGNDYRILVYKNRVVDVILRIPAYVTGNGTDTIAELIAAKNQIRKDMRIAPIPTNKAQLHLEKQGLSFTDVPDRDQKITVIGNCNFSQGGETSRIPLKTVDPETLEIAKAAAQISKLSMCGVDVITKDITTPKDTDKKYINEINASPSVDVHYYADNQENLDVIKEILKIEFSV